METHTGLFHPDYHVVLVEGGREEVKYVETRHFVVGKLEGKKCLFLLLQSTHSYYQAHNY